MRTTANIYQQTGQATMTLSRRFTQPESMEHLQQYLKAEDDCPRSIHPRHSNLYKRASACNLQRLLQLEFQSPLVQTLTSRRATPKDRFLSTSLLLQCISEGSSKLRHHTHSHLIQITSLATLGPSDPKPSSLHRLRPPINAFAPSLVRHVHNELFQVPCVPPRMDDHQKALC